MIVPIERFGWLLPGKEIFAYCVIADAQPCDERNKIILQYDDVEGNPFYTVEIEEGNFIQKSFVGNP